MDDRPQMTESQLAPALAPALTPVPRRQSLFNVGYAAFTLTALVGVLFPLLTERYSLPVIVLVILIGLAYIALGTVGFAHVSETCVPREITLYLCTQTLLAGAALVIGQSGGFWLFLMPLVSHAAILLPRLLSAIFAAAITVGFALLTAANDGLKAVMLTATQIGVGVFFTYAFSIMLVRSERERSVMARLAAELRVANQKLSDYAAQVEELAITRERNRVAREIHDSLGHYLTVANVQLEAARVLFDSDPTRAKDALTKAQTLTKGGLNEVRRSVAALRSSPLDNRSLPVALRDLAQEGQSSGLIIQFSIEGAAQPLGTQIDLTLFRVVQEGLTNVRKHSTATQVDMLLRYSPNNALVQVQDDGQRRDDLAQPSGFGLTGLRERVHLLAGELLAEATIQGFLLRATIPYDQNQTLAGR